MKGKLLVLAGALALGIAASPAAAHDPIPVEYTTADGVKIKGSYWTPIGRVETAPVAILLHMYQSDRDAWVPQIVALEYAGFAIMTIDLRGHGKSVEPAEMNLAERASRRDPSLFGAMHHDVDGAYEWLRKRKEADLSRVALVGASVGCSVALDYARRDKSVDVVAMLSPGTNYMGVDSVAHVKEYGDRPMLILAPESEGASNVEPLLAAAKAAGVAPESALFPGEDLHGTKMYGKIEGVDERVAAFLKAAVAPQPGPKVYAAIAGDVYFTEGAVDLSKFKPDVVRVFSNAAEAEKRGLKPAGE